MGQKSSAVNSRNDLAAEAPDSSRQIHRYIRLTNLLTDRDESYWDNYPGDYNNTISLDDIKLLMGRCLWHGDLHATFSF